MGDLFRCDLTRLSMQDLEESLGLLLPEMQRMPEGERIDYKQDFPQDLGDSVAAMANRYGGLIFLGIKSDKKKKNVPVEWRGVNLGSDPSARISNHVTSTVRPRPLFEIGLVQAPDGLIAVIRVQEGDYPPYEFQKGGTVRIPIRINDTASQASVRDIEQLLERRGRGTVPRETLLAKFQQNTFFLLRPGRGPSGEPTELRDDRVHKILAAPRVPMRLRFDVRSERQFEQEISAAFPDIQHFSDRMGSASFFQVQEARVSANPLYRVWRIACDGAVGFIRNMNWHGTPGEPIGDVAVDVLFFLRLIRSVFARGQCFGSVFLMDSLSLPSTTLLAQFPEPDGVHGYDEIQGVRFPQRRPERLPGSDEWTADIDFEQLANPVELASTILFYQLRAISGASIDYDELSQAIGRLDDQTKASGWGRS